MAERLLASRVADGRGRGHHGPLTFDHLAAWYLDDYLVCRLRTVDTARGRVANLRATFGGQPATVMTTEAIRSYQRTGPIPARLHEDVEDVTVLIHGAPQVLLAILACGNTDCRCSVANSVLSLSLCRPH